MKKVAFSNKKTPRAALFLQGIGCGLIMFSPVLLAAFGFVKG